MWSRRSCRDAAAPRVVTCWGRVSIPRNTFSKTHFCPETHFRKHIFSSGGGLGLRGVTRLRSVCPLQQKDCWWSLPTSVGVSPRRCGMTCAQTASVAVARRRGRLHHWGWPHRGKQANRTKSIMAYAPSSRRKLCVYNFLCAKPFV